VCNLSITWGAGAGTLNRALPAHLPASIWGPMAECSYLTICLLMLEIWFPFLCAFFFINVVYTIFFVVTFSETKK
jgi:hypothetical protein